MMNWMWTWSNRKLVVLCHFYALELKHTAHWLFELLVGQNFSWKHTGNGLQPNKWVTVDADQHTKTRPSQMMAELCQELVLEAVALAVTSHFILLFPLFLVLQQSHAFFWTWGALTVTSNISPYNSRKKIIQINKY